MPKSNIVLVDRKPIMNYVLACITLITGGASKVGKHPKNVSTIEITLMK